MKTKDFILRILMISMPIISLFANILSIIVNNRIESERFYLILAAFIFICIFVFYKKIKELQQPIITTGDSSEQKFWSYRYKNKLQFFTKVCCCFLILSIIQNIFNEFSSFSYSYILIKVLLLTTIISLLSFIIEGDSYLYFFIIMLIPSLAMLNYNYLNSNIYIYAFELISLLIILNNQKIKRIRIK